MQRVELKAAFVALSAALLTSCSQPDEPVSPVAPTPVQVTAPVPSVKDACPNVVAEGSYVNVREAEELSNRCGGYILTADNFVVNSTNDFKDRMVSGSLGFEVCSYYSKKTTRLTLVFNNVLISECSFRHAFTQSDVQLSDARGVKKFTGEVTGTFRQRGADTVLGGAIQATLVREGGPYGDETDSTRPQWQSIRQ